MTTHTNATPWFLLPFVALWKFVALLVNLTGRLVAVILGATLMLAGGFLCLTVIGTVVGLPLAALGLIIVLRGLF
jgi:hypothetical protein